MQAVSYDLSLLANIVMAWYTVSIIREHHLSDTRPPLAEIVRIAHDDCSELDLQPISRKALQKWMEPLDLRLKTKARYEAEATRRRHDPPPA
jgi:hypothetical protein